MKAGARLCSLRTRACAGALGLFIGMLPVASAATADASISPNRSGQSVFGTKCAACHTYGMRGAPKMTDAAAWAPRLAQGTDALYAHTLKGYGWMPSRGSCSACSDEEVKAAVDHMLTLIAR